MSTSSVNRLPFALACLGGLAVSIYFLHPILMPFVLGALIAYLGDPLVDRLEDRGFGRSAGVAAVFFLLSVLLLLILMIGLPLLINQLDALVRKAPEVYRWLSLELLPWMHAQFSVGPIKLPGIDWEAELAANWQSLGKITAGTLAGLTRSGIGLIATLFNLMLVPVVAFYLMRDWDVLVEKLLNLVPVAWQQQVSLMVSEANDVLGAFMRGQMLVMLAQAIIYSAGLWLVGLEFAIVLGTVAGLAAIIPYAGAIIGVGSSLLVAWFQFGGEWLPLLWVGSVFAFGQTLESMALTPILVGDRIGLHPVAVIFALMVGGQLAGFTGVLIALPVAAVLYVFFRHGADYYRRSDTYQGE